jgi:cytoskeletal protein RodZ
VPGEILKKRREELKKDLKDIAHILKIRYDYLKAIEEDDFDRLPVPVYTRGYIRGYANFLNIDPEPIIKAYNEKISPPVVEKPTMPPENEKKESKKTRYLALAVIMFVIAAGYVAFSILPKKPEISRQKISPIAPAKPPLPVQQPQPEQPSQEIQKETIPAKKIEALKEHTLEISATDTTWLLVNIDNVESKEMLLKKGDSATLTAKEGFSLKIGNAGGIKIISDGKDIGFLGEQGQVVNLNLPQEKKND